MKMNLFWQLTTIALLSGCGTKNTRIENPDRAEIDGKHQNLFASHFVGAGPHHVNDELDLLKPEEKKLHEPSFLDPVPAHKYDKSHGYSYHDLVHHNIDIDEGKMGKITCLVIVLLIYPLLGLSKCYMVILGNTQIYKYQLPLAHCYG